MNDYFDYSDSVISVDEKTSKEITYSSISYPPQLPLKTSMLKTKILQTEKFRPDKVSYRLFGDPFMSWLIDDINNFYSFKDYEPGKEIYYLGPRGIESLGIEIDYTSFETQNF